MSALSKICKAGFELNLVDDSLEVKPASNLNQRQREFLRFHKAELIAEIKAEQVVNDIYIKLVICYTPNGNPIEVPATSAEHAAWLQRMNPKPTPKGDMSNGNEKEINE